MKNKIKIFIILIVGIIFSFPCQGQNQEKDVISFYKEMPHYSDKGVTWQRDIVYYRKFLPNINLYKSSFKEYPYMYKYIDDKGEIHYFFIKQNNIKIDKKNIQIKIYDESNMNLSIFKMFNDSIFSFQLN